MNFIDQFSSFLQSAVQMGTPLLFGTLGGIMSEKVGNLNLGVEGMMLMGASVGFLTGVKTGSPITALIMAGCAGMLGALIYAIITVTFRSNHTVTGLVLTIFGTGLANYMGADMATETLPKSVTVFWSIKKIPFLSDIPILGKALFTQSYFILIAIAFAFIAALYIKKTKMGLKMRIVGENPAAADASGINVTAYKYIHICIGGFICGLGGAYLSLSYLASWKDDLTAGIGWIAVALVIFSTWSPSKAIFGAYLFGALRALPIKIQNLQVPLIGVIPSQFLDMLPYLMTIIVLVIITANKKRENLPPAALGVPYFREER